MTKHIQLAIFLVVVALGMILYSVITGVYDYGILGFIISFFGLFVLTCTPSPEEEYED